MYILNDINLEEDTLLESYPVCMKDKYNGEISCMGILVKKGNRKSSFKIGRYTLLSICLFLWKKPY